MAIQQQWLDTFNAFIEDTSVCVAVAYLLTRGRTLVLRLDAPTLGEAFWLGIILGLFAMSEVIFPGARSPYVFHSLIVCVAVFLGGYRVAIPAVVVVFLTSLAIRGPVAGCQTLVTLLVAMCVSLLILGRWPRIQRPWALGLIAGIGQAGAVVANTTILPDLGFIPSARLQTVSVFANAFGTTLVMLVIQDAQTRAKSEQNRLDIERMKMLVVSADLAVLRARIRPHFLFNTLTAIAALCGIDPARAEMSILRLGTLMRRTLDLDPTGLTNLESEMEYVRAYIDIQNVRFAGEIASHIDLDLAALPTRLPAYCVQTLVENAFQHGFERWSGEGAVRITARRRHDKLTIAVQDSGRGMTADDRETALRPQDQPRHGLAIIDKELRLVFGDRSRLRVWSREGTGTLVAFQVPLSAMPEEMPVL